MWQCTRCRTEVEDEFQVCWSCGTSIDGTPDPGFAGAEAGASASASPVPEELISPSDPAHPGDVLLPLDAAVAQRFRCPRCRGRGAATKRIATTGTGLSRALDIHDNEFLAVTCRHCGYTELYDPSVHDGGRVAESVLELMFGE